MIRLLRQNPGRGAARSAAVPSCASYAWDWLPNGEKSCITGCLPQSRLNLTEANSWWLASSQRRDHTLVPVKSVSAKNQENGDSSADDDEEGALSV